VAPIDFFLIVEDGFSPRFINDNNWFGRNFPIFFAEENLEVNASIAQSIRDLLNS